MKRLIPITIILVFLSSAFFVGCEKCDECENPIIDTIYDTIYVSNLIDTITYDEHVAPIINNYCITCHGGTAPSANLWLTNYNEVKDATQHGNLISRINSSSSPMPPSGLITQSNRAIIQEWVDDGYLEN